MRVTRAEVAEATGLQHVEELTELSLANKYVHELGFVAKMRHLRDLNLAFNELESIDDLRRNNTELRRLNVAHNKLRSLAGTETMTQLRSIRASNNRLRGLQSLAACRALEECWLQHNKLADLVAIVDALRALPNLRDLVLMGNPCCEMPEYRAWVISQLPALQLLDGQDVGEERAALGDGPAPQLGQLCSTDLAVADHSGSSDEDSDTEQDDDAGGGPQLRRGEWTVTDARGQKVHMSRRSKHTKKAKSAIKTATRRSGVQQVRDYDYGLQGGVEPSSSPRDELRQALAGLRKWTDASLPVVERFAAAMAVIATPPGADTSASARARSRSRHTPREQTRAGGALASHRKASNAATETCRRLQRAATHAVSEAAPSLRLAEELLQQRATKPSSGKEGEPGNAPTQRSLSSPRGSPGQRPRKRPAASVRSQMDEARSVSNSRARGAVNGLRSINRPAGISPRSPQLAGKRTKSTSEKREAQKRAGSNGRGSSGGGNSRGNPSHAATSSSTRSSSTSRDRQMTPPHSPPQPLQPEPQQQQQQDRRISAAEHAATILDQVRNSYTATLLNIGVCAICAH